MERVYGQMPARGGFLGGLGFGGTFLNTLAGAFVGTAIAQTLFGSYGYPPGDPADSGSADGDSGDGDSGDGGDGGDGGGGDSAAGTSAEAISAVGTSAGSTRNGRPAAEAPPECVGGRSSTDSSATGRSF